MIVASALPVQADRTRAAALLPEGRFLEVHVDALADARRHLAPPLQGNGGRAFAGGNQPYDFPEDAALVIATEQVSVESATERVMQIVIERI